MAEMKALCNTRKIAALFIVSIILITGNLAAAVTMEQPEETHNVSVDVMIVPMFAVDSKGNPVHDLKQEELELYVNGEPVNISQFFKLTFDHQQVTRLVAKDTGKQLLVRHTPERFVFIIIDSVFNSFHGYRRAKKIAEGIVKNGSLGDRFVVLENTGTGGLRYIAGPMNKEEIVKSIKKLKVPATKWDRSLFMTRSWNELADSQQYDPRYAEYTKNQKIKEKLHYKQQAKYFSRSLGQFKYALKSIVKPKIVYLISEGIWRNAFRIDEEMVERNSGQGVVSIASPEKTVKDQKDIFDRELFKYLQAMVHTINEGGSVFYAINPAKIQRDNGITGDMSLKYLASEGGGKYIAGTDTGKIIQTVKKTTAAYYELAFHSIAGHGNNFDIQLKCSRPGIKIHSLNKTEKGKAYSDMLPVERKLFALNAVTGGSWSRIVGEVNQHNKFKKKKTSNGDYEVSVTIPDKLKGQALDLVFLSLDSVTKKANINLTSRKVEGEKVKFLLSNNSGDTRRFFSIIEPRTALCLFHEIK